MHAMGTVTFTSNTDASEYVDSGQPANRVCVCVCVCVHRHASVDQLPCLAVAL